MSKKKQPSEFTCSIMNLISTKENLQIQINHHQQIMDQINNFLTIANTSEEVKNPGKDFIVEVKFALDNLLAKRRKIDMQIADLLENKGVK